MKVPSYLKKKLKDGKKFENGNSKWVSMFYCTTLISDSLQENFSLNGKDRISSKKSIIPELS